MKMKAIPKWWQTDCSINGLFNELNKKDYIKTIMKYENDTVSFEFHKDFKFEVKFNGVFFNAYINGKFESNVEEQDIYEYIEEIINDTYVVIEYKSKKGFFRRRYLDTVLKSKFYLDKYRRNRKTVKRIFTIYEVLFESNWKFISNKTNKERSNMKTLKITTLVVVMITIYLQ